VRGAQEGGQRRWRTAATRRSGRMHEGPPPGQNARLRDGIEKKAAAGALVSMRHRPPAIPIAPLQGTTERSTSTFMRVPPNDPTPSSGRRRAVRQSPLRPYANRGRGRKGGWRAGGREVPPEDCRLAAVGKSAGRAPPWPDCPSTGWGLRKKPRARPWSLRVRAPRQFPLRPYRITHIFLQSLASCDVGGAPIGSTH
jgi:hypothetical protein